MKVLVSLNGGLGDELCLTPSYRALKKQGHEIHAWVTRPELVLLNPDVHRYYRRGKMYVNPKNFDKYYDLKWQVGPYIQHSKMHLVDFFAMQFGLKLEDKELSLYLNDDDRKVLHSLNLPTNRPIITFDAYGNKPSSRWGSKYFRNTIQYLKKHHNAFVIQIGTQHYGIPSVDINLTRGYRESHKQRDIGIREMASIIEASNLYIGCNSGAAHIASAVKTPSVKIYGSTNYKYYEHNPDIEISVDISDKLECVGCINNSPAKNPIHRHKLYECPEKKWGCLVDLLPDRVISASEKMLDKFYYGGKNDSDSSISG